MIVRMDTLRALAWPFCVLFVFAGSYAVIALASSAGSDHLDRPSADGVTAVPGGVAVTATGWGPSTAAVTADGVTWRALPQAAADDLPFTMGLDGSQRRTECAAGGRSCYRTVPGRLAVEESSDGGATWRTAVSVSSGRQLFLGRSFPGHGSSRRSVVTQDLGVLAVPGGHVVVAVSGPDGLVTRRVDGGWERVGFPAVAAAGERVTPWTVMSAPPGRLAALGTGIARELAATGAAVLVGVAVAGPLVRRRRVGAWLSVALAAGAAVMLLWSAVGIATLTQFATVAGMAGALGVALTAWWVVAVLTGGVRARVAVLLAGLAVAVTATAMWPLLRWTDGAVDAYEPALRSSLVLTGLGVAVLLAAAGALGVLERRRTGTAAGTVVGGSTPARRP
jgi:hypothetical protein